MDLKYVKNVLVTLIHLHRELQILLNVAVNVQLVPTLRLALSLVHHVLLTFIKIKLVQPTVQNVIQSKKHIDQVL